MDNKDKTNNREDEILIVFGKIARLASGGGYVYRGQSDATYPYVSSTLYRVMKKRYLGSGGEWRNMNINMNQAQKEVLKNARRFATEDYDDEKMLSHIQHYSGDTNLIDFTRDCYVALFFACEHKNGKKDGKNGKVFLLKSSIVTGSEVEMVTFAHPLNRAVAQKSIFVQSRTGIIPESMMASIEIPLDLKQPILDYLRVYHGISEYSIYNDLHGYIRNSETQGNFVMEFYLGVSYADKSKNAQSPKERNEALKKAIGCYDKAIQLAPNIREAYNNRGFCREILGDDEGAISDYDKAIALNPNDAIACHNRGNLKRKFGNVKFKSGDMAGAVSDYEDAISDYDKADALVPNDEDVHYNRGLAKEMLGGRKSLQQALSDFEIAKQLARQQNKQSMVDAAQKCIERVTKKISEL